jgi:hypothetical protein
MSPEKIEAARERGVAGFAAFCLTLVVKCRSDRLLGTGIKRNAEPLAYAKAPLVGRASHRLVIDAWILVRWGPTLALPEQTP